MVQKPKNTSKNRDSFYFQALTWIDSLCKQLPSQALKNSQKALSLGYRNHFSTHAFTDEATILSYAAARMPATYHAVQKCYQFLPESFQPKSLLDIGAGPGTASLAALDRWSTLTEIAFIEDHPLMIKLAKNLWRFLNPKLASFSMQKDDKINCEKEFDVVILSYVLGELTPLQQEQVVLKAWQRTKNYCLLITPGTRHDFNSLLILRQLLLKNGAFLRAPCPHHNPCPMQLTHDWCHFSVRLERSPLHQKAKQARLNYEDEKFSYLIFSKNSPQDRPSPARIIHKPIHRSGHVILDVCQDKTLQRNIISKKDPAYKNALQAFWGDCWPIDKNPAC